MLLKKKIPGIGVLLGQAGICNCCMAVIFLCCMWAPASVWGQKKDSLDRNAQKADTSDKIKITIANSENFISTKTDSGEYNKFINNVVLYQGTDTLYCDSLYQNSTTKNFEAFGDVKVAQKGGTHGTSDYLRYTTNQKLAYMRGNVHLSDGKNNLACEELTYNLAAKIAVYDNWGQLHNDSTTVTSKSGIYNSANKNARFTTHVIVNDPQYNIKSEDLVYNTETKVTEFYAKSVVTRDNGKSILETRNGTYDGLHGIAHFLSHSSIWNDGQYIEGDSLYYNKLISYGLAEGHVVCIDTQNHSVLFCGHAEYFTKRRVLWATVKPVLLQVNSKDSLYMRADTFYSAPMEKLKAKNPVGKNIMKDTLNTTDSAGRMNAYAKAPEAVNPRSLPDSVNHTTGEKPLLPDTAASFATNTKPAPQAGKELNSHTKNKKIKSGGAKEKKIAYIKTPTVSEQKTKLFFKVPDKRNTDTTAADSTAPLYFIGYHHVLIFSDSLQGKCDSVCYTRSDSTIRMMYKPIAWAHNSQVTGDTILLQLDSTKLKSMYVPNNAFVVSQSGPAKAQLYDQVQGKTLTAYFKDNAINKIFVFPDAQSIYYSKDDKGYYIGVNQAESDTMRIYFAGQKISKIFLEPEVHQTMTPLEKADLPNTRLSRFKWLIEQRPKSKEELFR